MAFAAEDVWKNERTLALKCAYFTTDDLGNFYTVEKGAIHKYNSSGEKIKSYSVKNFGTVHSIDASNPLRILVFFKDFARILILDSQLSPNGEALRLENYSLEQSDLACTSFNNGMWFYNRQNAELVRLNENLNKEIVTGNLNRLLNKELHPHYLLESNGYVFLKDAKVGILVFDIYGSFYKTLPILNENNFQVKDQVVLYHQNDSLKSFAVKTLEEATIAAPVKKFNSFNLSGQKYYFLRNDSLHVFTK